MKTNAGQTVSFRLLREITAGTRSGAAERSARPERGSVVNPGAPIGWRKKPWSALRAAFRAVTSALAETYRLCGRDAGFAKAGEPRTLSLRSGDVCNLTKEHGSASIEVQQGLLWLTGDPAAGDVLLGAGDVLNLGAEFVHVAQALSDATIVSKP